MIMILNEEVGKSDFNIDNAIMLIMLQDYNN